MLLTIIFELIYTMWPFFFWVVIGPLWLLSLGYQVLEFISQFTSPWFGPNHQASLLVLQLYMTYVLVAGFTFIERLFLPLYNKLRNKKVSLTKKSWLKVWFIQGTLAFTAWITIDSLLQPFFLLPESFVIGAFFAFFLFFSYGVVFWYGLVFLGEVAFNLIKRKSKLPKWAEKIAPLIGGILLLYPFLVGLVVIGWFFIDTGPQGSRFAVIHAAIKNTCLIDPRKENCPHSLEEISYIEPQRYKEMIDCCQVQYTYDPQINQYTLVVRTSPVHAVIFDQRLLETDGLDFREADVWVLGRDKIKNPPNWDGPWTLPDWKYIL